MPNMSLRRTLFNFSIYKFGDQSWFTSIAKSLLNLQEWYGPIPNVHLHGNCAKGVYELMNRLSDTSNSKKASSNDYKIGHLFLLDRSIYSTTKNQKPLS